MNSKRVFLFFVLSLSTVLVFAQSGYNVKVQLQDSLTKAPIEFATVYISVDGTIDNAKYSLSNDKGMVEIVNIKNGNYILTAEMMGYIKRQLPIKVSKNSLDLGILFLKEDVSTLEQASISAVGNPIVVKKDTIEYNAASFKTTDNDMLEDLLKKLPGVEVASDGTITANGQTINKITIDGRTFFLDDPQLATKNIPSKIVNKVKVVEKKSEQAEFTGIDDGEEETIIDLSIKPGMMKGWFGNVAAGGGHDLTNNVGEPRYQGSAMVGNFTDKTQLSFIGNGNNTNNRGFRDMAGEMMSGMRSSTGRGGGMMGGGGGGRGMWTGNGVTTSWMAGLNGNTYFLDDKMEFGGNYLYNGSDKYLKEKSTRLTMLSEDESLLTENGGESFTMSQGHRAGMEIDYKINDKTSILFRPQFNSGMGDYQENSEFSSINSIKGRINDGYSASNGENTSFSTNGFLLLRQKIGNTKGRTLSASFRYSISQNDMEGNNKSVTRTYTNDILNNDSTVVDQYYQNESDSYSLNGRLSYTEPLGKNFYIEASYRYGVNQSNSQKNTYNFDAITGKYSSLDQEYSSDYRNTFINQNAQLNFMKQEEKYNIQVGFSAQPSSTKSIQRLFAENRDSILSYSVINYAPSARFDYRFSDFQFLRVNYRGRTNQPTITQLAPVPDNSNPLYISLGNPSLQPEFTHHFGTDYRYTNMENYASMNFNVSFDYIKDDIVTASWYNASGVQYSAPINATEAAYSANFRCMFNTPIAKSKFSVMSFTNFSLGSKLNYTGNSDVETIEEIMSDLVAGRTTTMNVGEGLTFIYRGDKLEARVGGRASYSDAWYSIKEQEKPSTWTNSVTGELTATLPWGIELKSDARYVFYIGYDENYNKPQMIWNAEISKLLLQKKATLRFKVYDLLNQSRTIYRTTADNYYQDVQTNTLGQYFIISFTYRFGNFGDAMRNGGGRGPMGGRPRMH